MRSITRATQSVNGDADGAISVDVRVEGLSHNVQKESVRYFMLKTMMPPQAAFAYEMREAGSCDTSAIPCSPYKSGASI